MLEMLDYQLVRAFAAVLDEGGFARAADSLCITQSAVSQRVKQLEDLIGRSLIIRDTPPRPTEAGTRLLRHYRQVLALEAETVDAVSTKSPVYRPHVPIAVNTDSLFVWFLDAAAPFALRSGTTFELIVDGHEQTIKYLKSGAVAGCVTSERDAVEGCTATRIGSLRYVLVASADFVRRWFPGGFTREAATKAPLVNLDRNDRFQLQVLYKAFGDPQVTPPAHYIPVADKYFQAIREGLGYGLVAEIKVLDGLADETLVDLDPGLRTEIPLYWHVWKYQSELLKELSDVVIREGSRLLA